MKKYSKESNNEQLSEIAGGVKDSKGKIMPSIVASMLSLLIMAQTGVSAVANEVTSSPSVIVATLKGNQYGKGFISRHKGKLLAGAGVLAAIGIYLVKNQTSKYEKELMKKSKEELIYMLPNEWKKFWNAQQGARAFAQDVLWADDGHTDVIVAYHAICLAARNADSDADVAVKNAIGADACDAAWGATIDADSDAATYAAFINSWRGPNGAAYNKVKDKGSEYFVNSLKVLREQTDKLNKVVADLRKQVN